MSRRRYTWDCPRCGATITDGRAWLARRRPACLSCTRTANGWQHQRGCTLEDAHQGACNA